MRTHIESYWVAAAEGGDATALKASQVDAIEDAFEAAGLVFTNGEEPEVKFRRPGPQGGLRP